jgi:hypothetical protein
MSQEFETADLSNPMTSMGSSDNSSPASSVSGVGFNESKNTSFHSDKKKASVIYRLAMKTGWVKNEKEANIVLSIFIVVIFILAILIWPSSNTTNTPTPEQEQQMRLVEEAMKKGVPVK